VAISESFGLEKRQHLNTAMLTFAAATEQYSLNSLL